MEKIGRELMSLVSECRSHFEVRRRISWVVFFFGLVMHILYDDFDLVLLVLCQKAVFTPFFLFFALFLLRRDRRWFRKCCYLNSMRMKENKEFKEVQMRRSSRFELEGAGGSVAARRRHNGYTFPTLWLDAPCTFSTNRRTLFLHYSSTSSHDLFIK